MEKRAASDALIGLPVEIRKGGKAVARGIVDAAMSDSSIVWLKPQGARQRTLYEAALKYEVWMDPTIAGFAPTSTLTANPFDVGNRQA